MAVDLTSRTCVLRDFWFEAKSVGRDLKGERRVCMNVEENKYPTILDVFFGDFETDKLGMAKDQTRKETFRGTTIECCGW